MRFNAACAGAAAAVTRCKVSVRVRVGQDRWMERDNVREGFGCRRNRHVMSLPCDFFFFVFAFTRRITVLLYHSVSRCSALYLLYTAVLLNKMYSLLEVAPPPPALHCFTPQMLPLPPLLLPALPRQSPTLSQINRRVAAALVIAALAGAVHGFIVSAFIGIATASVSGAAARRCIALSLLIFARAVFASIEFGDVECAVVAAINTVLIASVATGPKISPLLFI
jgi:hypothetical protein